MSGARFHGFPVVAQIPARGDAGWGIVVTRPLRNPQFIAFYTRDLDAASWGQGHYFDPASGSADAVNAAREAAVRDALDLAGWKVTE